MKVAIFLCYGLYEPSNQEYTDYIDQVAKGVTDNNDEKLIICGGHTNPKKDISEAETVFNYLNSKYHLKCEVVLEDKSLTTPQNLNLASKLIDLKNDQITVYCDLYRLAKVIWLSAHFLLSKSKKEISDALFDYVLEKKIRSFSAWNLNIIPFDFPSRDRYQASAQTFSSLLEVEALYDPELDEKILNQRKKDFGIAESKIDQAIEEAHQEFKSGELKPWPIKK